MKIQELLEAKTSNGDCFRVAGRNMLHSNNSDMKLVHAFVSGQGPLQGRRFEHAWNEIGDTVIDNSNGRNISLPKEVYYSIGNINSNNSKEYRIYNKTEALNFMVKTKNWGPWEI